MKILYILSFLFSSLYGFSQSHKFKTYLTEQGQGIKAVRAMIQDSKGFLWIGSAGGGVCRFDGRNYLIFTKKDGLCSDDVNCVFEDSESNIWIGTATGISKFKDGIFVNFPEETELARSSVYAIVEDHKKNLWLGGSAGVYKYKDNFTHYTEKDGLADIFISSILCDSKGILWFGTSNGEIYKFKNNKFKKDDVIGNFINHRIWALTEDEKGNLWIGSEKGVCRYFPGNGSMETNLMQFTEKQGLNNNHILSILADRAGNLWFGTSGSGICKYEGKQFINFSKKEAIQDVTIWPIIQDREGNMWYGYYGTGLTRMGNISYNLYNKETGLPENAIWMVKEDLLGNIWTGLFSHGISILIHTGIGSTEEVISNDNNIRVYYLFVDGKNQIWTGTNNGIKIYKYDSLNKKIISIRKYDANNGLAGNLVRYIFEDSKRNLWIGTTTGTSVMRVDNKGNYKVIKNYTENDGLIHNSVYSIIEDKYGVIWFATINGVSKFDGKEFYNYHVKDGLAHNDIRSIIKDRKERLWFGTGAGISLYEEKRDTFINFTSKDGLSSDRLYFLQYDSIREVMWVGSAFGLDKFDLGEYDRSGKIIFNHLSEKDGFMESETNSNAVCIDKSGNLWMGTMDGLIKYYPEYKLPKNEIEPHTHILNINVNKKDTVLASKASLPYNLNNISFEFVGICLTAPDKVRYRFMLAGFEKEWNPDEKDPVATYSNLDPGDYVFKVIACNNDEVWNKEPTTFIFTITPPYWETAWFYSAQLLFFMLLIGVTLLVSRRSETKGEKRVTIFVYICLFIIFDFIQTLSEPMYESFAGGAPIVKTLLNLAFAGLLMPAQEYLRKILRGRRSRLLESKE